MTSTTLCEDHVSTATYDQVELSSSVTTAFTLMLFLSFIASRNCIPGPKYPLLLSEKTMCWDTASTTAFCLGLGLSFQRDVHLIPPQIPLDFVFLWRAASRQRLWTCNFLIRIMICLSNLLKDWLSCRQLASRREIRYDYDFR